MLIKNIDCVVLYDATQQGSGLANGGEYGFWSIYHRNGSAWERSELTTAEFSFCCCGYGFTSCNNCPDSEGCQRFVVITNEELANDIVDFITDDSTIDWIEEVGKLKIMNY